jgi:predicted metal-dependent phosphoesterase TrpH
MELVTVSDHDSIDAAEELRSYPDFFLSEEVTCATPSGTQIHVGVYGIEDHHHEALQKRRNDVPSLAAYLGEQRLFFSINHVFSSLTGRRTDFDFQLFDDEFPAIETRNGHIPEANNRLAERLARDWRRTAVAGSDAHTLSELGLTYTEVPDAQSKADFLHGLRRGTSVARGVSGNYLKLTRTVLEIGAAFVRENPWTAALAPLFLLIPGITLANRVAEYLFEQKWSRRVFARDPQLVTEWSAD